MPVCIKALFDGFLHVSVYDRYIMDAISHGFAAICIVWRNLELQCHQCSESEVVFQSNMNTEDMFTL